MSHELWSLTSLTKGSGTSSSSVFQSFCVVNSLALGSFFKCMCTLVLGGPSVCPWSPLYIHLSYLVLCLPNSSCRSLPRLSTPSPQFFRFHLGSLSLHHGLETHCRPYATQAWGSPHLSGVIVLNYLMVNCFKLKTVISYLLSILKVFFWWENKLFSVTSLSYHFGQ